MISYTNCSLIRCSYIIGEGMGNLVLNQSQFEQFVSTELQRYFDSAVPTTNANSNGNGDIEFVITNRSKEVVGLSLSESIFSTSEDSSDYIFYVLLALAGIIAVIGIIALAYDWGLLFCLPQWVDVSLWASWLALSLQFWDFASDISLTQELWSHPDLWDPQKRLILICAVGCATFIVVPYVCNLYVAGSIKRFVKGNEAASAWYVMSCELVSKSPSDVLVLKNEVAIIFDFKP